MPSTRTQPSEHSAPSRSSSPSPAPSRRSPTEITTLLAPSTPVPAPGFQQHSHLRKTSVGGRSVSGRSVAGSVHRGYGSVNNKPGPASQAPRVSKVGQRVRQCHQAWYAICARIDTEALQRILTTWPIQVSFFALVAMAFLSFCLTLMLWANTFTDLNVPFLPNRWADLHTEVLLKQR